MTETTLTIGTRGSALALWQANHIRDRLLKLPGVADVKLDIIKTKGDRIQHVALSKVGGKGLFVKEIEQALLDGRVDLAVHSMKDMPSDIPVGLSLSAVPLRANPLDAWVRPAGASALGWDALPQGAVVGTSSLRRSAQLLARRPDLQIVALRGNVDTRLRKLDAGEGEMQAIVLACAGLERLGWGARITRVIPADVMLPAVGQGALALQSRTGDPVVTPLMDALNHTDSRDATAGERAFLAEVEGSCQIPIGAHGVIAADGETLEMTAVIADPAGAPVIYRSLSGPRGEAVALGQRLAQALLAAGGREILDRLVLTATGA